MKRILIFSLALVALSLVIRWQAPGIIYHQLEQQLAKYDVELNCLDWHIDGFQQLGVDQLCVSYHGIVAEAHAVELALMQAAFWQNDFDWKNLVPEIKAKKFEIVLPDKIDLAPGQTTSHQDTTSGIPTFWLPDVAIEHVEILSPSTEKNIAFGLNLSQEKQQRTLFLKSLDVAESASFSVSQKNQELMLEWQIALPWLHENLLAWTPLFAPVPQALEAIAISSGELTGEMILDVSNLKQFRSTHVVTNFEGRFNHESFSEPLKVSSNEQFQVNRQDELIIVTSKETGNTHLSNFDAIAGILLKSYQWQGITVNLQSIDFPEQSPLNIALPSNIKVQLSAADTGITAIHADSLSASNNRQQMRLSELTWQAETGEITTQMYLNNLLFLEKEDLPEKVRKNNQISIELKGLLNTDLNTGFINLEQFTASGIGLGSASHSVLDLPQNISWYDTELNGLGNLQWQERSWEINADYSAKLTSLKAFSISFDKTLSVGKLALSDKKLNSFQTLALGSDVSLQISTAGTIQQLTIDAILPDAQLGNLNELIQQYSPDISLTDGAMSAAITSTLSDGILKMAELDLVIENGAGSWHDYQFLGLSTAVPLSIDESFEISAQPKQLQITELQVGTPVSNIDSRFLITGTLRQPQIQLQQLSGEVFHGNFTLQALHYPFTMNNTSLLTINQFQLNEMVNLFGDQGIDISGSVSGEIPLSFSEGLVSIEQAIVKADNNGKLSIKNNTAFRDLKNSQGTLGIALTLLEELNYTTLQSEVRLEPDGWMTLGVNITGVNPQQEQPINFNPTLTTNLFTGLKALRAGQNVADSIEQQLQH